MLPSASIAHRTPGRIRLRIPSAKADSDFFDNARARLSMLPGVLEVTCNPLTGSILVLHAPDVELDLHGTSAPGDGGALPFVVEPAAAQPMAHRRQRSGKSSRSDVAQALTLAVAELDDLVREATDNAVDLKVLLPLAAAALGLTLIGRGHRTPVWLTLIMFAFSSFMSLHDTAEIIAEEIDAD
jgi:hypothetical protein